jgi:hypothetical protein
MFQVGGCIVDLLAIIRLGLQLGNWNLELGTGIES